MHVAHSLMYSRNVVNHTHWEDYPCWQSSRLKSIALIQALPDMCENKENKESLFWSSSQLGWKWLTIIRCHLCTHVQTCALKLCTCGLLCARMQVHMGKMTPMVINHIELCQARDWNQNNLYEALWREPGGLVSGVGYAWYVSEPSSYRVLVTTWVGNLFGHCCKLCI